MTQTQAQPLQPWCLGQLPAPGQTTQRCTRRETCRRYVDRHHSPSVQAVAQWLCPGQDSYWPAFEAMGAGAEPDHFAGAGKVIDGEGGAV